MQFDDVIHRIKEAADVLLTTSQCPEDKCAHNGRRAYTWTLLRFLHKQTEDEQCKTQAVNLLEELRPHLKKNPSGATIMWPGQHVRRNYSTNAIDCGIFADAYGDLQAICPNEAKETYDQWKRVVSEYITNKIQGPKKIHNQYLWASTGLAQYIQQEGGDALKEVLLQTILDWCAINKADGYAPYMSCDTRPDLDGMTGYYHGRCIAFAWYGLDALGDYISAEQKEEIESVLQQATRFLAAMYTPEGYKNMDLETKRFYFSGPYETASHPHDIYCFVRTHKATSEEIWLSRAAVSLRTLLETPLGKSHGENALSDWQCPTMRLGHLAWLCRIEPDLLRQICDCTTTTFPYEPCRSARLTTIKTGDSWQHCIFSKSMLSGFCGQAASGYLEGKQYCNLTLTGVWKDSTWRALCKKSVIHALLHSWDTLLYKNQIRKAWHIFWHDLVCYLFKSLFTKSTAYCCDVPHRVVHDEQIKYDLIQTNIIGTDPKKIGERIIYVKDGMLHCEDTLL